MYGLSAMKSPAFFILLILQLFITCMACSVSEPVSSDSSKSFRRFKTKFRKHYGTRYAEEEEYSNPSIYALRAYDAAWTIAEAMDKSPANATSKELFKQILSSNSEGLSGRIRFRNTTLLKHLPTFQVINVVGKSYREVAIW